MIYNKPTWKCNKTFFNVLKLRQNRICPDKFYQSTEIFASKVRAYLSGEPQGASNKVRAYLSGEPQGTKSQGRLLF